MLSAATKNYADASVMFMLASLFRSNGFILSGFIVWGMMVGPLLSGQVKFSPRQIFPKLLGCLFFSAPPFLPYFYHQYKAYRNFCTHSTIEPRPWCSDRLPSIYSYVQSAYWNVGLFRYWSLQQLPNILLAMPVLLLLFDASIAHIRYFLLPALVRTLSKYTPRIATRKTDPLFKLSVAPHAIHALLISIILLVAAHTQIALRFASAMPFTYWAAARLFLRNPQPVESEDKVEDSKRIADVPATSRWWTYWSVLWGACSLVTWAVFLPPA